MINIIYIYVNLSLDVNLHTILTGNFHHLSINSFLSAIIYFVITYIKDFLYLIKGLITFLIENLVLFNLKNKMLF